MNENPKNNPGQSTSDARELVGTPTPQLIHWAVDDAQPPGICIDEPHTGFVSWLELKKEVEDKLLPQAVRVIPYRSTVKLAEFRGHENHQVLIISSDGEVIGRVWFGKDPYQGWSRDGLVRLGNTLTDYEAIVWQIYQRYSNGTYRRIRALDADPESDTAS